MSRPNAWMLLLALMCGGGIACQFNLPDLSTYPPCADGCPPGCFCLAGKVCVPEKGNLDPRCCEAESCPECLTDADCPNSACHCQGGVCLTSDGERDPSFCGKPPPFCSTDLDCDFGCQCINGHCQPPAGEPDPDFCSHGFTPCSGPLECRLGCSCDVARCWPMDENIPFAYCTGSEDYQDLMCQGPSYTVQDEDVLEYAILQAAQSDKPYGIIFDPPGNEIALTRNMPPIPSLVYIDGQLPNGAPVTLRGDGATVGLTVQGKAVVLHRLKLVGFPDAAIVIKEGSEDVHLYRLRIGAPAMPNGDGIVVEPGTRDVFIGRGREIGEERCVSWEKTEPVATCETQGYDVNVIVANEGDGIRAIGVSNLLIEGTWVGFDTVDDCDMGGGERPELANQGAGIRLESVTGARLGLSHVALEELERDLDLLPGCVAVGRSVQGGVAIRGGGDITMRCTLLGDTPLMVPYYENQQFGLSIEDNTAPVSYGAPAEARGLGAESMNLVHVLTTPAIRVANNKAPVWIRGAQLQSLGSVVGTQPVNLVEVLGAEARVDLVHLSFFGGFRQAALQVSMKSGVEFTLSNSYFRAFSDTSAAVINLQSMPGDLNIHHVMKVRLGPWCTGNCPALSPTDNMLWEEFSEGGGWRSPGAVPVDPACQVVDRGQGMELDVNGLLDGLHSGCCPDLGAWECTSDACRAVETNCSGQCP